jgi:hypothetical protein
MDKTKKHKSNKKINIKKLLKNKSLKYFNINLFVIKSKLPNLNMQLNEGQKCNSRRTRIGLCKSSAKHVRLEEKLQTKHTVQI